MIPEWGMWWGWLMHSPPVWQASTKGFEAITLVPNPIGISPQMHVTCGWRGVLMHKHYNMSTHQYFLCFVTMLSYVILLAWVENCLFVCICFKCFYIVFFYQSFLAFMSKIQKHIKSRKSKKFNWHIVIIVNRSSNLS